MQRCCVLCFRSYSVHQILNTNLMLVAYDATCKCSSEDVLPFTVTPSEVIYILSQLFVYYLVHKHSNEYYHSKVGGFVLITWSCFSSLTCHTWWLNDLCSTSRRCLQARTWRMLRFSPKCKIPNKIKKFFVTIV